MVYCPECDSFLHAYSLSFSVKPLICSEYKLCCTNTFGVIFGSNRLPLTRRHWEDACIHLDMKCVMRLIKLLRWQPSVMNLVMAVFPGLSVRHDSTFRERADCGLDSSYLLRVGEKGVIELFVETIRWQEKVEAFGSFAGLCIVLFFSLIVYVRTEMFN